MDGLLLPRRRKARSLAVALLDLVEQHRPFVGRGRSVDVLGVAGDGDTRVLRARYFHGRVLDQLSDHRVRVRVGPAVQFLHDFGNAEVGGLHIRRIIHQSHPIILLR